MITNNEKIIRATIERKEEKKRKERIFLNQKKKNHNVHNTSSSSWLPSEKCWNDYYDDDGTVKKQSKQWKIVFEKAKI